MPFDSVLDAIRDIGKGKLVIVADDEDRENEGDLVCAAEKITPALINFMTRYGRGLICASMTPERADDLGLPLMTDRNTDPQETAFTVSVDGPSPLWRYDRHLRSRPRQDGWKCLPIRRRSQTTCAGPGMSFPSVRAREVCCGA